MVLTKYNSLGVLYFGKGVKRGTLTGSRTGAFESIVFW